MCIPETAKFERKRVFYFRYIPPVILAISLLSIYLITMAPGLTWANAGADGGDLITAAYIGGVAHPTGYPLYMLLARVFQSLPIGALAFRTNLMSALATVSAGLLLYVLVIRWLAPTNPHRFWLAGLVSAFVFGLSPLVWSQAIITEVYALHSLFVVLVIFFSTEVMPVGRSAERLRGLTLGLAMGNHLTAVLLVPFAFLVNTVQRSGPASSPVWLFDWRSLLRQAAYLAGGLLIYLVIPLRAMSNPPVNWGNPVTFDRFWWLISGGLYQNSLLPVKPVEVWNGLQAWASILLEQFGVIGLLLALTGLILFFSPSRFHLFTLYIAITFSIFSIVYRSFDSYVYLIPALISFSIWMGLVIGRLMDTAQPHKPRIAGGIVLVLILSLSNTFPQRWRQVDASQDQRAEHFGEAVLDDAPLNAIIFTEGDQAIFAMWYFHFALQRRPDLMVIATDLLHFDWYQETLKSTYPSLRVPVPFPWPETIIDANPAMPVCFVEYREQEFIDCQESVEN